MKAPSKTQDEDILSPIQEITEVSGDLCYSQGHRAWGVIQLKKDIIKKFPRLKNRQDKFSYKMIIPETQEDIAQLIAKLKKEDGKIPILLFFCKKKIEEI